MSATTCPGCGRDLTYDPGLLNCPDCRCDLTDFWPTVMLPAHDTSAPPSPDVPVDSENRASGFTIRLTSRADRSRSDEFWLRAGEDALLGRHPVANRSAPFLEGFDDVSRIHATVGMRRNGEIWIRDERSANGTWLNDAELVDGKPEPLRSADVIRLGEDVELRITPDGEETR